VILKAALKSELLIIRENGIMFDSMPDENDSLYGFSEN